jgi:hypothetical protein
MSAAAARLRTALELQDLGIAMMTQRLRREHPGATDAEVRAWLRAWLDTRPGAELGDGVGRPAAWPRR